MYTLRLKIGENMATLEALTIYAKSTGFIYQGSEIYGGLANTWDYGPLGSLLKNNIKKHGFNAFKGNSQEMSY
jgi:glycyl-tRNA synthetase